MRHLIIISLSFLIWNDAISQTPYEVDLSASKVTINGTSSIHDWTSDLTKFSGNGVFIIEQQKIVKADNVTLSMNVKSIKSGKSIMDSKTRDALQEEDYPTITFKSTEATLISDNKMRCKGNLTMAGVTREIVTDVNIEYINSDLIFNGIINITMSQNGIEPPVALLGTLKTGDEVAVEFNLNFEQNNNRATN
jgi:polyisoprenoid-binding protein YceI